jgi:TolA-binding protein
MKDDLTKKRILAVVLGTSWSITLLAFVYMAVNADKQAQEREEFLKAKIEVKVCQEKAEALVKQLGDRENQLRRSLAELENALVETRLAKEFKQEQSKMAIKKK